MYRSKKTGYQTRAKKYVQNKMDVILEAFSDGYVYSSSGHLPGSDGGAGAGAGGSGKLWGYRVPFGQ